MNASTTARVLEVPTQSTLEKRRWRLANGASEVELIDESEATWEKFCAELARGNARVKAIADARKAAA